MGTDSLGRDLFSRVLWGSRLTLPYAALLVGLSSVLGGIVGGIAGYVGGVVDDILMRFCDLVFAFPTIILALAVGAALGPSLRNAVLAIVVVSWPIYARVVRSFVLSHRQADYVSASRLLGSSMRRTLIKDVLPNLAGPMAVLVMLEFGSDILLLSGLSFLGLGAPPDAPEWGRMISEGTRAFDRWWLGLFPGLAILSAVLAVNLIGDSLRDAVDPRVAKQIETGSE